MSIRDLVRVVWFPTVAACALVEAPGVLDSAGVLLLEERVGSIAATLQDLDEVFLLDGEVALGAMSTDPDASGSAYFVDVTPGRAVVQGSADGFATSYSAVAVPTTWRASTQIFLAPVERRTLPTPAAGGNIELGAGATVTFDPNALLVDQEPPTGPLEFEVAVLDVDQSKAVPGDGLALADDEIVSEVTLLAAFYVDAAADQEGLLKIDGQATSTVTLPPGVDPAGAEQLFVYRFDEASRYWRRLAPITDLTGDVVTSDVTSLGWLAIGAPTWESGTCLSGTIVRPDGGGLAGAEVLATEAGRFGSRRVNADEQGRFCIGATPGATATLRVWGVGTDLGSRFGATVDVEAGGSAGTCGGTCTTVGELPTLSLEAGASP